MWPFKRKTKYTENKAPGYLADNREKSPKWFRGDLAECIASDWRYVTPHNPEKGDILRVTLVEDKVSFDGAVRSYFLCFEGLPHHLNWDGSAFRKIVPVHTAASDEFIAELRDKLKQPEKV